MLDFCPRARFVCATFPCAPAAVAGNGHRGGTMRKRVAALNRGWRYFARNDPGARAAVADQAPARMALPVQLLHVHMARRRAISHGWIQPAGAGDPVGPSGE